MDPVVLAALLSILPTQPSTVANDLPVAVTSVEVQRADGRVQTLARIDPGRQARVRGADRIVSFEMESCRAETRAELVVEGSTDEVDACWRALERESPTLRTAGEEAWRDLRVVFIGPASLRAAAASRQLPELVSVVAEGGALGHEIEQVLGRLGWSSSAEQLRRVPRARRPDLLLALGRHEDGRAFGLLVRAALESSIEAERVAAVRALADYPEDAVQRLSNALEDPSSVTRERAAEALTHQDARALPALRTAATALGVTAADEVTAADLARAIARAHESRLAARADALEEDARGALAQGDVGRASEALALLDAADRSRKLATRDLRARLHVLQAEAALSATSSIEERGRDAAEALANAQSLDAHADGLVDTALSVARFFLKEGYPASASRVLGPFEDQDPRAATLRTRALGEEVRRLVAAGDRSAANIRLTQLVQEGRGALADDLDDRYDVHSAGAWTAPASLGMLLFSGIGLAVLRERRRRRQEFALIETEQDRGRFNRGPYR